MSKRDLNKYLKGLTKRQLEEQIMDLYGRFKDVKTFYDFAFNPKEDKLIEDARYRISEEYFPTRRRKARKRRSVAQKLIKHFLTIGVEPQLVADVMLYNIEISQAYCDDFTVNQISFYQSILNSYQQAVSYISDHSLEREFYARVKKIAEKSSEQKWINSVAFKAVCEELLV